MEIRKAPPLGTLPFPSYHETVVTLEPGDTLLLYTDGLIERRGEPLTAGLERLRMTVGNPSSAEALCARVVLALVPEGGDDDIALLALRTLPVEPDLHVRFAADPDVLARIRQILRRWLHGHGANPTDVASLTLAVGEACANAIEHAYAPGPASFELEAAPDAGVVTLTVRDTGSWRPPRGEHRGRGLKMIEAAVDEVDVRTTGAGTEVLMRQRLAS
jgi:anti-sigma regulatory factor (Ser/Thr protein kinase)